MSSEDNTINLKNKTYWSTLLLVFFLFIIIFVHDYLKFEKISADEHSLLTYQQPQITTLVAVGDILLSRHVGTKIDEADNPNLPFENLQDLLKSADLTFGNLECPLSDSGIPIREGLVFRCLIEYVPGLKNAGFDVLSTANNHSFDQGEDNVQFTIDHLTEQSILPVGTGKDFTGAHQGKITKRNQISFGFLAYSYTARNDGGRSIDPQIATWDNLEQVTEDIKNLKEKSDVIVVSLHAGVEYTRNPTQEQINFARTAVDAGADMVIGHHPHWIQTVEIYKDKPIFYSLGNFVFDQEWSRDTKEGLAVKFSFSDLQLTKAELVPVVIENFCCPRFADEQEKPLILRKIGLDSDIINFSEIQRPREP